MRNPKGILIGDQGCGSVVGAPTELTDEKIMVRRAETLEGAMEIRENRRAVDVGGCRR